MRARNELDRSLWVGHFARDKVSLALVLTMSVWEESPLKLKTSL
jgi:hypothetical protein